MECGGRRIGSAPVAAPLASPREGKWGLAPGPPTAETGPGTKTAGCLSAFSAPAPESGRAGIAHRDLGQGDELIEPELGDDRVVIEQDEVFPAGILQALVDRRGESDIPGVGDHGDRYACGVLDAGQVGGGVVGRAVIDDDQLPGGPGESEEGLEAMSGERTLVEAGDDDRGQSRDGWVGGGNPTVRIPVPRGAPPSGGLFSTRLLDAWPADGPYEPKAPASGSMTPPEFTRGRVGLVSIRCGPSAGNPAVERSECTFVIPGGRGSVRAGSRDGSPGGSPSPNRANAFTPPEGNHSPPPIATTVRPSRRSASESSRSIRWRYVCLAIASARPAAAIASRFVLMIEVIADRLQHLPGLAVGGQVYAVLEVLVLSVRRQIIGDQQRPAGHRLEDPHVHVVADAPVEHPRRPSRSAPSRRRRPCREMRGELPADHREQIVPRPREAVPDERDIISPGDLVLAVDVGSQASGSQVAEAIPTARSRSAPSRWAAKTRSKGTPRKPGGEIAVGVDRPVSPRTERGRQPVLDVVVDAEVKVETRGRDRVGLVGREVDHFDQVGQHLADVHAGRIRADPVIEDQRDAMDAHG